MKTPIHISDADAPAKLRARIEQLEAVQLRMKEANAAIRKHKAKGAVAQVAALVALGFDQAKATLLLQPDFCGRIGFANYELTNNGANIRRLKEQLAKAETAQATPETTAESPDGIRLEDCPADNRVRLFFPGKPDSTVRYRLKTNGFRWTPSLGCWQAYRNAHALGVATSYVSTAQAIGVAEDTGALVRLQAEQFAGTHPDFQAEIRGIAEEGGKTVPEVFALWREYSAKCHDQSALLSEFREWYAGKLGLKTRRERDEEERQARLAFVAAGTGLEASDIEEINILAGGEAFVNEIERDYGGVLAADGHVYSDADSGL